VTGRGVAIYGGLAALGLIVAYATWQREPDRATGEVVVVDATKSELANVHFEDENNSVDIRRGGDGDEPGVWVRIQDKTPVPAPAKPASPPPPAAGGSAGASGKTEKTTTPPPAPAPVAQTPPPAPAKPKPVRQLRGDEPADKFLTQFTPFRSPRAFGVLDAKKVKELGLETTKKKLVITARGETREFAIGQPPQGSGENYLRDVKDGRTYLMPRQVLADLQGAAYRLVDRKLHDFKLGDVNRLVVASSGKKREFVIKTPKDPNAYKLAPSNTPDKPDEMARNWHEKVWKLFPVELLGKGEAPPGGPPKILTRIDYFDGSKNTGWIEIGNVELPPGSEPAPSPHGAPAQDSRVEIYGRSENTAGWVRLRNDPSLLTEADKIASGS
jgi:hypothetical protein